MREQTNPLVSIVIPVYNVEHYVMACVHSVVSQTYKNLEIVLVDDGSTDSSGKICDDLQHQDSRLKVIHQMNKGLSGARNTGTSACKGDWILYVDSDDVVTPHFVEHLLKAAVSCHSDVAICKGTTFTNESDFIADERDQVESVKPEEAVVELFSEKKASTAAWGKIATADLWKSHLFPEGQNFEDLPTTWRLLADSRNVSLLTGDYYGYRKRSSSISSTPSMSSLVDYDKSIREVWFQAQKRYPKQQSAIAFRCSLEYCRLLEMISKVQSVDQSVKSLYDEALSFLKSNSILAFSDNYASTSQRLRIIVTSILPHLITNIRSIK